MSPRFEDPYISMASNLYTGLFSSPILATAANSAARTITAAANTAVTSLLQPRATSQAVEPVLYSNIDLNPLDATVNRDAGLMEMDGSVNVAMQGGRGPRLASPVRLASPAITPANPNDEAPPPPYSL